MAFFSPADIWRIVKDVDLDGIRDASRRRVDLVVASEDGTDARAFAEWLVEGSGSIDADGGAHPWVRRVAARDGMPALEASPAAAVLVSAEAGFGPALTALRDHFAHHSVPLVAVLVGNAPRGPAGRGAGEWSRAVVSRLDDGARDAVAGALLTALPRDLHMSAGREFPPLRQAVSVGLIDETAKANAGYAFTTALAETVPVLSAPLAVGDMVVLTKNQLLMCYRIVLAHGRQGDPRSLMGEIVGVLGGGVLLRQAARQLVGLIPVLGIVPKVAIAYAGTWAIGRAMAMWAGEGREVTAGAIRRYSREGLGRGRVVARAMYDKGHDGVRRVSSSVRSWRDRPEPAGEAD